MCLRIAVAQVSNSAKRKEDEKKNVIQNMIIAVGSNFNLLKISKLPSNIFVSSTAHVNTIFF